MFTAPLPLTNINSTYEIIGPNIYQVNVSWDMPKHQQPDYYNVTLNVHSEGSNVWLNVSGVSFALMKWNEKVQFK